MTLGRTSEGKIKIKTDGDAGLRAVECGCCGPCNGCKSLKDFGFATSVMVSIELASPYDGICCCSVCDGPCEGTSTITIGELDCSSGTYIGINYFAEFGIGLEVVKNESEDCYVRLSAGGQSSCYIASYSADGIAINGFGSFTLSGRWRLYNGCADCEFSYYYVETPITITLY